MNAGTLDWNLSWFRIEFDPVDSKFGLHLEFHPTGKLLMIIFQVLILSSFQENCAGHRTSATSFPVFFISFIGQNCPFPSSPIQSLPYPDFLFCPVDYTFHCTWLSIRYTRFKYIFHRLPSLVTLPPLTLLYSCLFRVYLLLSLWCTPEG